jgi:hypothetical protein
MNKIIIALISLALVATPALACTGSGCFGYAKSDVRTSLFAAGETSLKEYVDVSGFYAPHGAYVPTAYVVQNVNNDGTLAFMSQDTNYGQWKLQEDSVLSTTGKTDVEKQVVWWTVDPTTDRDGDTLIYPTVANIYTQFDTDAMTVIKEVENTADLPGTNYANPNVFAQSITTKVPMTYMESVGINKPLRCDVLPPLTPTMPICEGCLR